VEEMINGTKVGNQTEAVMYDGMFSVHVHIRNKKRKRGKGGVTPVGTFSSMVIRKAKRSFTLSGEHTGQEGGATGFFETLL